MSTVAATTGPSLCVMTEIDNKLTNKKKQLWKSSGYVFNTIHITTMVEWREGIPSSINTIIDIAVNASA